VGIGVIEPEQFLNLRTRPWNHNFQGQATINTARVLQVPPNNPTCESVNFTRDWESTARALQIERPCEQGTKVPADPIFLLEAA